MLRGPWSIEVARVINRATEELAARPAIAAEAPPAVQIRLSIKDLGTRHIVNTNPASGTN